MVASGKAGQALARGPLGQANPRVSVAVLNMYLGEGRGLHPRLSTTATGCMQLLDAGSDNNHVVSPLDMTAKI